MKIPLPTVTLLGIDCIDINRLIQAANICMKDFDFGEVKLLSSLPSDNNVVAIDPITSVEEYSEFIIRKLNSYVDTDFVLIIQYDGFILNPKASTGEFLKYDYIGAPWHVGSWETDHFSDDLQGKFVVGNGGFSLRSKKLLGISAQLAHDGKITKFHPEDVALCVWYRELLEKEGIAFAPVELAKCFSLEGNDIDGIEWTDQFGFHGLKWTDISLWLQAHPEYQIENPLDEWALATKEKFSERVVK